MTFGFFTFLLFGSGSRGGAPGHYKFSADGLKQR